MICLAGDLIVAERVSVHPAKFVQGHDVFREIDLWPGRSYVRAP
jgi:hypothetical protein